MLFFSLDQLTEHNNVNIKTITLDEIQKTKQNIDLKLYSEYHLNREAGYPNIFIKNNEYFLASPKGLYQLNDCDKKNNSVKLVNQDIKTQTTGHRDDRECVLFLNGKYIKYLYNCHGNERRFKPSIDENKNEKKIKKLKGVQPNYLQLKNRNHYVHKFKKFYVNENELPLLTSNDCLKWNRISWLSQMYSQIFDFSVNKTPQPSYDPFHTITILDSLCSLIYFKNKYYFYSRINIGKGCRYIQVTESNDLKTWSRAKDIKMTPEFGYKLNRDNYYTPTFFVHDNYIIGLLSYLNLENNVFRIKLFYSYDGEHFVYVNSLNANKVRFKGDLHKNENFLQIIPHSFFLDVNQNSKINFYSFIHSEKQGYKPIYHNKCDYLSCLTNVNNQEGKFSVVLTIKKELKIKFKGDIQLKIDNIYYVFYSDSIMEKVIDIITDQKMVVVECEFNGEIYYISGEEIRKGCPMEIIVNKKNLWSPNLTNLFKSIEEYSYLNKFTKLRYYYFNYNDYTKNTWKEISIPETIKLIDFPIYSETKITQKLLLTNNSIKEIVLETSDCNCILYHVTVTM